MNLFTRKILNIFSVTVANQFTVQPQIVDVVEEFLSVFSKLVHHKQKTPMYGNISPRIKKTREISPKEDNMASLSKTNIGLIS